MNLLNVLLKTLLGDSSLAALMKKTGLSAAKLKKLIPLAVPLLLKYLTGNASTEGGALSLLGALGQHSGTKALPAQIAEADETDGGKILGHIFGKDNDAAVQDLAKKTGMTGAEVSKALGSLAPALLNILGSAAGSLKGKVDLSDGLDLSDLAALLGGGKVSSNPLSLFGSLMNGGQSRKDAKNNSLNGNDLLSSLMSFMG
jgi:hypothetical protein